MGILELDPPGKFHQPTQAPFSRSWLQTLVPTQGKVLVCSPHDAPTFLILRLLTPLYCITSSSFHLAALLISFRLYGFGFCSHSDSFSCFVWHHLEHVEKPLAQSWPPQNLTKKGSLSVPNLNLSPLNTVQAKGRDHTLQHTHEHQERVF